MSYADLVLLAAREYRATGDLNAALDAVLSKNATADARAIVTRDIKAAAASLDSEPVAASITRAAHAALPPFPSFAYGGSAPSYVWDGLDFVPRADLGAELEEAA